MSIKEDFEVATEEDFEVFKDFAAGNGLTLEDAEAVISNMGMSIEEYVESERVDDNQDDGFRKLAITFFLVSLLSVVLFLMVFVV